MLKKIQVNFLKFNYYLIIFILFIKLIKCQNRYICGINPDNSDVSVPKNGYIFYQSNDYPKTLNPDIGNNPDNGFLCNKTFKKSNDNKRLWLTMTNAKLDILVISDSKSSNNQLIRNINTNNDVFTYTPSGDLTLNINTSLIGYYNEWNAFQAVIVSVSSQESCPLESSTINLSSDDVFIPISSQIFDFSTTNYLIIDDRICNWMINIPVEYKLKIVIRFLNLYADEALIIQSDDDSSLKINNTNKPIKYILTGKKFDIKYNRVRRIISNYGFFAVISMIKTENILFNIDENITEYNPISGYEPNEERKWNYNVSENTNLMIYVDKLDVEAGCDKLYVSVKDPTNNNVNKINFEEKKIVRIPDKYNSTNVIWKSDENNEQAGYSFNTTTLKCQSTSLQIPIDCYGNYTTHGLPDGYCYGQQYRIEYNMDKECKNVYYFNYTLTFRLLKKYDDKLYVNDQLMPINPEGTIIYESGADSKNPLIIKFQAGQMNDTIIPTYHGFWSIKVNGYNLAPDYIVTLNDTKPYYHHRLSDLRSLQKLKIISKTGIEMYIHGKYEKDLNWYSLYVSDKYIDRLDSNKTFVLSNIPIYPRYYITNGTELYIQKDKQPEIIHDIIVVFKAINSNIKSCHVTSDDYDLNENYLPFSIYQGTNKTASITAMSSKDNACYLMLTAYNGQYPQIELSSINTNATDSIILYSGDDSSRYKYFEINKNNVDEYQIPIDLTGIIFSFIIPQSEYLSITFKNAQQLSSSTTTSFVDVNQTLFIGSILYGDQDGTIFINYYNNITLPYGILLADFEITLLSKELERGDYFVIISNNQQIDLKNVNENSIINITSTWFQIKFQSYDSFLIKARINNWRIDPHRTTTVSYPATTTSSSIINLSLFLLILLFIFNIFIC